MDVVVVGEGDVGGELEGLDLDALEVEGETWVERWSPEGAGVVGADAGVAEAAGLCPAHDGLEDGEVGGELGDEVEGLAGLVVCGSGGRRRG